jgi:hypothetical protein
MGDAEASAFDNEIRALVSQHCVGSVTLFLVTEVVWGKPLQHGE